jgi:hypothetical protein
MRPMTRTLAAVFALFTASTLYAQGPSADWRTVATRHFRVHYPAPYEAWSLRAASRLESIRDAVIAEVGFAPETVTDVIVANPIAEANGLTLSLLDTPRIVLFTESPSPGEEIGEYSDWTDLLAVHEVTHLVHLMRPSRNPLQHLVERWFLPLDPITLGGPRWVLEGYATVVEGRITGAGRPSSTLRALVLRRWAETGHLPSYWQLDDDSRFLGMSMAYLAGSAYLEWLEQRTGPGSLRKLWARMTARQRRSFDEAFTGVFGDSPDRLYGIFTAQLTQRALTVDDQNPPVEGELFQETSYDSGDPAVSPDGKQIAVVLRSKSDPPKVVVWSTGPQTDEEAKDAERIEKMLKRDPEDVAPMRSKPLSRKAIHELILSDGGDIETPRWTANGRAILFVHRLPDIEGFLHRDLFRWTPETDGIERITRLADVSDADPLPDGKSAVAVRNRFGFSQIVMVNMLTGDVTSVTEPSLDRVYTHPRVSADGKRIVFAQHHGGWQLVIRELSTGAETPLPIDARTSTASPEWSRTNPDELYATVFEQGFVDIHRFTIAGEHQPVTRARGGAISPAPVPDGRVFFMSLDPDGFVVRVLPPNPPPARPPVFDRALVPALPPEPAKPGMLASHEVPPPRPYGIGRQEVAGLVGGAYASGFHVSEVGARIGDVIGRLDTLAVASSGDVRGGALATKWSGWPVAVGAHFFSFTDTQRHRGGELRASWSGQWPLQSVAVAGGALFDRSRNVAFADLALRTRQQHDDTHLSEELRASAQNELWRGSARGTLRAFGLRFAAEYDHARSTRRDLDLGGIATTVMPQSLVTQRILDPALPQVLLSGRRYDGWRAEVAQGYLTAFYRRHSIGGHKVAITGIEATVRSEAIPIVKAAGFEAMIGAGRILDQPLRGKTRWWLGVRWRP